MRSMSFTGQKTANRRKARRNGKRELANTAATQIAEAADEQRGVEAEFLDKIMEDSWAFDMERERTQVMDGIDPATGIAFQTTEDFNDVIPGYSPFNSDEQKRIAVTRQRIEALEAERFTQDRQAATAAGSPSTVFEEVVQSRGFNPLESTLVAS